MPWSPAIDAALVAVIFLLGLGAEHVLTRTRRTVGGDSDGSTDPGKGITHEPTPAQ